ncbi:LamG domain-containing protein [Pseudomonas sp. gcc21]|uniref:LamG-like jellyroll fold domain-containing protein n=1 Tax=Pseudomonas sp. gcc21 TaxID=2726989 RepID=UPI0014520E33|nr:LamG-like jellyroll fold domain-containing protein [Pseudomonas sp. gcc21]QJD58200.1 LamG domain-containing protein [Pseudomonas sp. gcc21]
MAETDLWFGTLTATVRVEDLPASRRVVAIELPADGEWRVCGAGASNAEGVATLPITGLPTSRIYAVAIDDWGRPFAPGMAVAYGDLIRPTQFVGWMYQVTQPGALPAAEPDWWNARAGIPQPVGTAMLQAIRHYQPIAHGPVSDIEWEEKEFDPHWDNVVALLHFDEGLSDEKGLAWSFDGAASITSAGPIYGSGSLLCDGPDDGCSTINPINDPLAPFTIETTVMFTSLPGPARERSALWGQPSDGSYGEYGLSLLNGTNIWLDLRGGHSSHPSAQSDDLLFELFTRYHLAHTFDGAHHRVFINGLMVIEVEFSTGWKNTSQPFSIGMMYMPSYRSSRWGASAKFDEFRITKGIARYTEDFTPQTVPFPNVGPPL